jgi:hypothetical protein
MHRSHWRFGARKAGFTRKIREDGFNGIVVIIRDDAVRMTYVRSAGGVRFGVMWRN